MLICKFNSFKDIPGSNLFCDKIPVFASQNYADYLKALKGHDIVWFAHLESSNTVCCLIPFAIIKKRMFTKAYFVTGVIFFGTAVTSEKEKEFLESVIKHVRENRLCDWIQQGPNWAMFSTAPSGSKYARYGTYKIILENNTEADLLSNMNRYHRKDINYAIKNKVEIRRGTEYLNDCLSIIEETAKAAGLNSLSNTEIEKLLFYFNNNLRIYVSYCDKVPQSAAIFLFNEYCTYGLYAGSKPGALRGSNAYLFWEAIKDGKKSNCLGFDFVGGRIDPIPGSKLERIQRFKEHFGSEFIEGYLWKITFSEFKYHAYNVLIRLTYLLSLKKYKPDIIDQESRRLKT